MASVAFRKLNFVLGLLLMLVACHSTARTAVTPTQGNDCELFYLSGNETRVKRKVAYLIDKQEDLNRLFKEHTGKERFHFNVSVDFERASLVAVFSGGLVNCFHYSRPQFKKQGQETLMSLKFFGDQSGPNPPERFVFAFVVVPKDMEPSKVRQGHQINSFGDYAWEDVPLQRLEPEFD